MPLLDRCPNRMVLQRETAWDDGSDHVCFVGTPLQAGRPDHVAPLRLSAVHIVAGHEAEERETPRALADADPDPDPAAAAPADPRQQHDDQAR